MKIELWTEKEKKRLGIAEEDDRDLFLDYDDHFYSGIDAQRHYITILKTEHAYGETYVTEFTHISCSCGLEFDMKGDVSRVDILRAHGSKLRRLLQRMKFQVIM